MHQPMGEIAVVGEEEEPLAVPIEPADGKDTFTDAPEQIQYGGASLGIT